MAPNILSKKEIRNALVEVPGWEHVDNRLSATYTFKDFKSAFVFMTQVAAEAERIGHHPEWTNVYNRVTINLSTHDAGDVVTDRDIELASGISQIYGKL